MLRDMRTFPTAVLLFCLGAICPPCFAAQPCGWCGHWRLSPSLSHTAGPVVTILREPDGYRFKVGSLSFPVRDDGRDYPSVPPRTVSLKRVSGHEWIRVHKTAGHVVDRSTLTVTPDGKTLRIHTITPQANGTSRSSDDEMMRLDQGTGLAGVWRSILPDANVPSSITISALPGQGTEWTSGDGQSYVVSPGAEAAPVQGRGVPAGVKMNWKSISAHRVQWVQSVNGKPYTEGEDVLSPDGSRITETTSPAGDPQSRQQAVYLREQ